VGTASVASEIVVGNWPVPALLHYYHKAKCLLIFLEERVRLAVAAAEIHTWMPLTNLQTRDCQEIHSFESFKNPLFPLVWMPCFPALSCVQMMF
jgi:hypothetical protein